MKDFAIEGPLGFGSRIVQSTVQVWWDAEPRLYEVLFCCHVFKMKAFDKCTVP